MKKILNLKNNNLTTNNKNHKPHNKNNLKLLIIKPIAKNKNNKQELNHLIQKNILEVVLVT
jgi:hypothetical protein